MPDAADGQLARSRRQALITAIESLGDHSAPLTELAQSDARLGEFSDRLVRAVLRRLSQFMAEARGLVDLAGEVGLAVDEALRRLSADLPVAALGELYEGLLDYAPHIASDHRFRLEPRGSARKTSGSYYTNPMLVDRIIASALGPVIDKRLAAASQDEAEQAILGITVCDPSCGCGAFLIAAARALAAALAQVRSHRGQPGEQLLSGAMRDVLTRCLYGVDRDPIAVALCGLSLWLEAGAADLPLASLEGRIQCGDALLGWLSQEPVQPFRWRDRFPEVFARGGFNVVVGNPPFVDSETMCEEQPEYRRVIANGFETARGNWDLYVPFLELALQLTRADGRHALLTPRQFLASDYCAAIHRRYLSRRLCEVVDCGDAQRFGDATVRVAFVTVEHRPADADHVVNYVQLATDLSVARSRLVRQGDLAHLPPGYLAGPFQITSGTLLSALGRFSPLANVADCSDGATTAEAYRIRDLVRDGPAIDGDTVRLVNTGTIDPYRLLHGVQAIKYLGFTGLHPRVDLAELRRVAPRRAEQAMRWKVVIAGLSRRIEAAVAPPGVLCGKSAVLVLPRNGISPDALAAWLNSGPIQELYRGVFGLRGFSSASMNLGPRQIERLPAPPVSALNEDGGLSRLGREAHNAASSGDEQSLAALQVRLDEMVAKLLDVGQTDP